MTCLPKYTSFTVPVVRGPRQALGVAVAHKKVDGATVVVITSISPDSVLKGKVLPYDWLTAINGVPVSDKSKVASMIGSKTTMTFSITRRNPLTATEIQQRRELRRRRSSQEVGIKEWKPKLNLAAMAVASKTAQKVPKAPTAVKNVAGKVAKDKDPDSDSISPPLPPKSKSVTVAIPADLIKENPAESLGVSFSDGYEGKVYVTNVTKGVKAVKQLRVVDRVDKVSGVVPKDATHASDLLKQSMDNSDAGSSVELIIERTRHPDLYSNWKRAILDKLPKVASSTTEQPPSAYEGPSTSGPVMLELEKSSFPSSSMAKQESQSSEQSEPAPPSPSMWKMPVKKTQSQRSAILPAEPKKKSSMKSSLSDGGTKKNRKGISGGVVITDKREVTVIPRKR